MQMAQLEIPEHRGPLIAGIKRLKATGKGPKYPVFYDISPLINFSFPDPSPDFTCFNIAQTLDILIMQLRLTTLMRAADISTIPWAVFHMNPKGNWTPTQPLFIHSSTKNGTRKTFSILGITATTLLHYIWLHLNNPAPFLLRHTDNPHKCLGSERISKRCLNILTNLDIDTQIFKSHSIRGATATHLAKQGVPLPWIQNRGGWQSPETLQKHYNALHQGQDWAKILTTGASSSNSGETVEQATTSCFSACVTLSSAEPRNEGESKESEHKAEKQIVDLTARGLLRYIHSTTVCPTCQCKIEKEAAYNCSECQNQYHVRCLSTTSYPIQAQNPIWTPLCFICSLASPKAPHTSPERGEGEVR